MVLLKKPISIIEDIIKNDYYNEEYFENFFIKINTFTSVIIMPIFIKKIKNIMNLLNY